MKAIQVTVDEQLLKDLDEDEEVKGHGRSAVMRRAVFDYLRKRRRKKIANAYRRAYGGRRATDVDWIGWTLDGRWHMAARRDGGQARPTPA